MGNKDQEQWVLGDVPCKWAALLWESRIFALRWGLVSAQCLNTRIWEHMWKQIKRFLICRMNTNNKRRNLESSGNWGDSANFWIIQEGQSLGMVDFSKKFLEFSITINLLIAFLLSLCPWELMEIDSEKLQGLSWQCFFLFYLFLFRMCLYESYGKYAFEHYSFLSWHACCLWLDYFCVFGSRGILKQNYDIF